MGDLLVDETFTWDIERAEPRRGGAVYRLGLPGFVTNEHAAFALGVARRALEEVTALSASKARGLKPAVLAHRETFQRFVGEAALRLRGARSLVVELNEAAWRTVREGSRLTPAQHAELRGAAVLATDTALDIVTQAFRFAGGSAVYDASPLQRCLRDLNAGAQHFMVSASAYDALGRFLLQLPSHPME